MFSISQGAGQFRPAWHGKRRPRLMPLENHCGDTDTKGSPLHGAFHSLPEENGLLGRTPHIVQILTMVA